MKKLTKIAFTITGKKGGSLVVGFGRLEKSKSGKIKPILEVGEFSKFWTTEEEANQYGWKRGDF